MNSSLMNYSNISAPFEDDADLSYRKRLKLAYDYVAVMNLILIMLAMGADITAQQVWRHIRQPTGVAIGMFCQFCLMPIVGFVLSKALSFRGVNAISILLISCSPGGAVSNIFTYYMDGDVSLSITMTSMSTLVDFGFMPLNFWIYGHFVELDNLVIPYKHMAISMVFVTVPAAVGVLLRWKYPRAANFVTKIGSTISILVIAAFAVLHNIVYPGQYAGVHWKIITAALVMPSCGIALGYCFSWVARQDVAIRKTVAIESGVQNTAVPLAIIALSSFTFEDQGSLLLLPVFYGIAMISLCLVMSALYRIWKTCFRKKVLPEAEKSAPEVHEMILLSQNAR